METGEGEERWEEGLMKRSRKEKKRGRRVEDDGR